MPRNFEDASGPVMLWPAGSPRRRLAEAASTGETVATAGNRAVQLDDPGYVWFVERGTLDVFLVGVSEGVAEAPFHHVLRLDAGRLAFGAANTGELRLVARGLPDTVLRRIPAAGLAAETGARTDGMVDALVEDADNWIVGISTAIAREIEARPRPDLLLAEEAEIKAGGAVMSAEGVLWICGGAPHLFGSEEPEEGEMVPVTPDSWAVLHDPADITVLSSHTLGIGNLLSRALPGFHGQAFGAERFNRRLTLVDQANFQVARSVWRRRDEDEARRQLFGIIASPPSAASSDHALVDALRAVADHDGIVIREPPARSDRPLALADLLNASGVRARRVRILPEDRWWVGDSGAMLAFRREGGWPVALLPGIWNRYRLFDPKTGTTSTVRRAQARELEADGYVLYRPLSDKGSLDLSALRSSAAAGFGAGLARITLAGVAAGILTLAPAVGIGALVERVIPSGAGVALLQLVLLLALLALTAAIAHMLRGSAIMRLEGQLAARMTAALWDRLLRLQTGFHRAYNSGDISMRALAFQTLRDRLSGATAAAVLAVLFLLPSLALLFFYDAVLGWIGLGTGIAALAVTVAFGIAQIAPQRRRLQEERLLTGQLFQFIVSVRKLQAAGAEGLARAIWARRYRRQKLAEMRINIQNEHLKAFGAAVPFLAAAMLFAAAHLRQAGETGAGEFIAIFVASMFFYASIVALGAAMETIASVVPYSEQVLPILAAAPDSGRGSGPPIVLRGGLRLEDVSFRYGDKGAPVLDRVSIFAKPSEFIAIVGESGAGKSTLIRLALGLETPTSGAVYYDDRNLAHLDPVSVRRQVGVVLQNGSVQTGTVLDNIIGLDRSLTLDDAWRAARQAVVDRDIAAMPMQMHTALGEQAAGVSGGQSQRIRVAAALARDPRIIFLDEATNWLDRKSQAALMEGIRNSTATRIVVAHRISTIREAHRIYVIEAGRVVQVGRFDELAGKDGLFRNLIQRQIS